MKSCHLILLVALTFPGMTGFAGEKEKEEEALYAQLNRAVIRLEHVEVVHQEKAAAPIVRNVPDGTAFFVTSGNELYVVSARHVVEKPYDLHARVQSKDRKTGQIEVILLELPRNGWVYHDNFGDADTRFVDVAVMKIPWIKSRSIKHFRYESKGSKDKDKNQLPFEDPEPPRPILVFGFPGDVGFQLLGQKPLGRLGVISMKTGKEFLKFDAKKFAEERCCLIDARMFPGNSGSPVMNQPRLGDSKPKLLGLVIASNTSLDFGVIEPVSRIRETLDLASDKSKLGHWKPIPKTKPRPVSEPDAEINPASEINRLSKKAGGPIPNTSSYPTLLDGWAVSISPWLYLITCASLSIVVRVVHCFIKALSTGTGEHGRELTNWSFRKRFCAAFSGFGDARIADHWLGTVIGFAEIAFYPVLIFSNNLPVIGGWLAIKTAGSWDLWHKQPRAFNRFLISNLVNLGIAYFVILRWITPAP